MAAVQLPEEVMSVIRALRAGRQPRAEDREALARWVEARVDDWVLHGRAARSLAFLDDVARPGRERPVPPRSGPRTQASGA